MGLRADISEIRATQEARLTDALRASGLKFGAPVYLRVFKETNELELWVESASGDFSLFRSYEICNYSGALGPKLKEGDRQSPEGFYRVDKRALNPNSAFHLSFNLGFPNAFDRANDRTGSYLMVHGNCVSVGCYAMTDASIEEIYVMVEAALNKGQPFVPVHAFPFRPTEDRMIAAQSSLWFDFWQQLSPAYKIFEDTGRPPAISLAQRRYVVSH
ncbi:L,D-transpeptidase family protein [Shimia sp. Alg240-R146]|uniref:L,D-transpeptidase family protein n=1 Tax=Shimia sp. Alg240-R146 TaxID=2993449 RepID=UPI0022E5F6D9|nr:murein L,D-transpeptidase family protein [Shimia sp. Alg240-R146]